MQNLIETQKYEPDRAYLVAVFERPDEEQHCREMLDELEELVRTSGGEIVGKRPVKIRQPQARLLLGRGKAEEIVAEAGQAGANLIVFDDNLSPTQQRNWEQLGQLRTVDRQEVILGIFADRASTREAELQIELAQAEYMLPRLKRAWTHLNRQRGGVGVRGGEGEKQIEIDSRLLRRRIAKLKQELKKVRKQRAEQRKKRQSVPMPNAAIVGYTNAGKSMLLNRLTEADVLVEDKLFATLDPTTRRVSLPDNQTLLLTDTVGFVRKLPHDLVEAFKATLEEAVMADFLVHVVDITSVGNLERMQTTREVLAEIGAAGKESLIVFNKIDIADDHLVRRARRDNPDALFISAKTGEGIDALVARMADILDANLGALHLCLPPDKYDVLAYLHRAGKVLEQAYESDGIYVTAAVPAKIRSDLEKYVV